MREFTKSVMRYTWAMSLFGVQQINKFVSSASQNQQPGQVTESFNKVGNAAETELEESMKNLFESGNKMQQEATDLMFSVFSPGVMNPGGINQSFSKMGNQGTEVFKNGMGMMGKMMESFGGFANGMFGMTGSCGGSEKSSEQTGWGPVTPPSRND